MKRMLALLLCFTASSSLMALEIRGVKLPSTITIDNQQLILNGAGTREKYFLHLYVGSLYLKDKQHDGAALAAADQPMAIRMDIISGLITGSRMADAVEEGFRSTTQGNIAPIKPQIDQLIGDFRNGIDNGDTYELIYIPGKGTMVRKNGKVTLTIPGLDFKKALFGIWIGEHDTINKSLKHAMLGT